MSRRVEVDRERELDEELAAALDELTERHRASGLEPEAARRAARLELGVEAVKEACREVRRGARFELFLRDVRFALRTLRRAPAVALVAVATLAFGVGGTTAIWSVVAALSLRPLPYPEADRLVHLWARWEGGAGSLSHVDYEAIAAGVRAFDAVAIYQPQAGVVVSGLDRPIRLHANFVSARYPELVGLPIALGRAPRADENGATSFAPVAVLSHAAWRRDFGSDPEVVGRSIAVSGEAFEIVGVAGAGFRDLGLAERGDATDLWLPVAATAAVMRQPPTTQVYRNFWALGRLAPGATLAGAQAELDAVAARLDDERPTTHDGYRLAAQTMRARLHGPFQRPAAALLLGALLLLAVAATNLAGTLQLEWGRRGPELALRAALGATTERLARQLGVELALVAAAGALGAAAVAFGATRALGAWIGTHVSPLVEVGVDARLFVAAAALLVATTLAVGWLPVAAGRRADLRTLVGARGATDGPGRSARRSTLVTLEVALSLVLLVGAALMARSVAKLVGGSLGFDTARLLTFRLDLTAPPYVETPARARFASALETELAALPGVESVTLWGPSMLARSTWVVSLFPAERTPAGPDEFLMIFRHSVNPDALDGLGIPLLRGRALAPSDTADTPLVGVVSESVARHFWTVETAVGQRFRRLDPALPPIEVVGVAADALHRERYSLDDLTNGFPPGGVGPQRDIYLPYAQRPNTALTVALRLARPAAFSQATLLAAVARLDPGLAVADVALLDDRLAEQERTPAALATLFSSFALFGLFLAALGVYGVVARAVELRRREFGIRIALGARPVEVARQAMSTGLRPALAGAALGLAAAAAAARALAGLLYGVSPADPPTLAAVALALVAAAALATALPAHTLLRDDPIRALRAE